MNDFRSAVVLATVIQVIALSMDLGSALAAKPLAEAARSIVRKLPKGVIVTAERSGKLVQFAAAGKREHPGIPPERVIFEIGSITKVFTGLLLAQAVVEGRVALDTPIKQLIAVNTKFADARVGAITLKQLATHTSGLPRMPDNINQGADAADPAAHYDRTKLDSYLASAKLLGEPPFEVSYSNLGVGLLGDLLSRVYGKPWEVLVAEKITGPLGLKDTVVNLSYDQRKRFATPYAGEQKVKPWALAALAGAGALRSKRRRHDDFWRHPARSGEDAAQGSLCSDAAATDRRGERFSHRHRQA